MMGGTVADLLRERSRETPDRVAILEPGVPPLTYGELEQRLDRWIDALASRGLPPRARIGIALPPGSGLAVALLAVCSVATCAPLRPGSPPAQVLQEAAQLELDLLVTAAEHVGELRDVGVPGVVDPAGLLASGATGVTRPVARPDDTALLLRTSGTTGLPKRVPLAQSNLCGSARNIGRSLRLTADDRCLDIMPLWHIHGFVAGLLASLAAGGSTVCAPPFAAEAFPGWLGESDATWYSAAPAIHHAILDVVADSGVPPHRLRFIRSASSSLPPTVAKRLEETFGVPAIEAYGMTEATHQIACNPLPPGVRKRDSVGIATGVRIAVLGPQGEHFPPGTDGEIAIQGNSVFSGYSGDTSSSFDHGWFRTGDRGHLDADGYLFITGRIKEMINRGGETIAPREIDEVLLGHPDVVDAAAFGVPHERLGETVAAAVVVRAGTTVTEAEVRSFVGGRLSLSKIPMRVLFVDGIPRNPTGKLLRAELERRFAALRTPAEAVVASAPDAASADVSDRLAAEWAHLLGVGEVGPDDSLSAFGSDSLLVARMVSRVEAWYGVQVPLVDLYLADTVAEQAELIRALAIEGRDHPGDGSDRER